MIPEDPRTGDEAFLTPHPRADRSSVEEQRAVADDAPTVQRGSSARRVGEPGAAPGVLPHAGDVLGGYVLEETIGVGGMGAVFRALDPGLDRQVAIKLLPPSRDVDAEVIQRFLEEGRSAARLDHDNIARVYSVGRDGPYHFIVFEYIQGETVRRRVEVQGPLPVPLAVGVGLEIARALVHASSRGVVHRDIKPSNIILTPQGRAKLVDMGLARRFEREGDPGLTQSGMTLGTFDYISPEQARDPRDVDVRSDLYSLGCTLFHMLTGRPPFPSGTMLQKLLQHQEEPPPDPRTVNAAIPPALAALVMKLMAKDRERRCQTPEHLVRELSAIAADLGMALPLEGGESWGLPAARPVWERHLVWIAPAASFLVILLALALGGRDAPRPVGPRAERAVTSPRGDFPRPAAAPDSAETAAADPPIDPAAKFYPRTIPVSSSEDLLEVLANAPARSIVALSDDGPYRIGGRAWSSRPLPELTNLDVTVTAEPGVRPVIKFAADAFLSDNPASSLFHFKGGRVRLEGLDFELDSTSSSPSVAAIKSDDVELSIRACVFRRGSIATGESASALVARCRPTSERPPTIVLDACHLDGDQVGIRTQGPVDVVLRDCTLGPGAPVFSCESQPQDGGLPIQLRLIHVSILAGGSEIFRLKGGPIRVVVDDSVIARGGGSAGPLLVIDDERALDWRGRGNIYSGIRDFIRVPARGDAPERRLDFAEFSDGKSLRELGSRNQDSTVWAEADPASLLKSSAENPSRVFRLAALPAPYDQAGARKGPQGALPRALAIVSQPVERRENRLAAVADVPRSTVPIVTLRAAVERPSPAPIEPEARPVVTRDSTQDDVIDDPMNMPTMPPATEGDGASKSEPGTPRPEGTAAADSGAPAARTSAPEPQKREVPAGVRSGDLALAGSPAASGQISDARQLSTALAAQPAPGAPPLTLAPGARLTLDPIVLDGEVKRRIVAGAGGERPRLRLKRAAMPGGESTQPALLLALRAGALKLEGIDLIVAEDQASPGGPVAAFGVAPGAELTLERCTITMALTQPGSAALFVVAAAQETPAATPTRDAVVRLRDCFLRSGGDGFAVAGGGRLDLQLSSVLASTEGSLVHTLGGDPRTRGKAPGSLTLRLDQAITRVRGGLVHLDSSREAPELASASITAENSVLSTAERDDALIRIDGQDRLEDLEDRIRWDARKVVYDRIKTYRLDEVVSPGMVPRIYDRSTWLSAFQPRDESPSVSDGAFLDAAAGSRSTWRLAKEDLRLKASASGAGPDLSRIPDAPAVESL